VKETPLLTQALHQSHNTHTANLHGKGERNVAQWRIKVSFSKIIMLASIGAAAIGKKACTVSSQSNVD